MARPGPAAYRILYRVDGADRDGATTWEERIVERPFRGRVVVGDRRPPRPPLLEASGRLSTVERVYTVEPSDLRELSARVPGLAVGDDAVAVVLADAVDRGLIEQLGRSEIVVGRECRLHRTGAPLDRPLQRPTRDEHVDVCVDDEGFVLLERWTFGGRVLLTRRAVELDPSPPRSLLAAVLSSGAATTVPSEQRPSRVRRVPAAASFLAAPDAPRGFRDAGVFEFVRTGPTGVEYQSTSWVFVRGADLLVVEAGLGSRPWGDSGREPEGELGESAIVVGPAGTELRAELGPARWLRVTATASVAWVEGYAESLRTASGRAPIP